MNPKTFLKEEYFSRINRVIDFIEKNIDSELTLEILASVANFSAFHFHRIFKSIVGESLNQFIQRVRLERAANRLQDNPKDSITKIAYDCGFSSSASFARAFKKFFNISASQWRELIYNNQKLTKSNSSKIESNNCKQKSNLGKDPNCSFMYSNEIFNKIWRKKFMKKNNGLFDPNSYTVKIKDIKEFDAAYVRHIGPYKGNIDLFKNMFGKLFKWAGARGLINFPKTKVLSIYHDNPETTDENQLRTSMCISVPKGTKVDGEIGLLTIEAGKYAVAHFEIDIAEYEKAWNTVCAGWLPESGFQPDDKPALEFMLNNPDNDPEGKHIIEIYIPIKPI